MAWLSLLVKKLINTFCPIFFPNRAKRVSSIHNRLNSLAQKSKNQNRIWFPGWLYICFNLFDGAALAKQIWFIHQFQDGIKDSNIKRWKIIQCHVRGGFEFKLKTNPASAPAQYAGALYLALGFGKTVNFFLIKVLTKMTWLGG